MTVFGETPQPRIRLRWIAHHWPFRVEDHFSKRSLKIQDKFEPSVGLGLFEALFHPLDFQRLESGFPDILSDLIVGDRFALALL